MTAMAEHCNCGDNPKVTREERLARMAELCRTYGHEWTNDGDDGVRCDDCGKDATAVPTEGTFLVRDGVVRQAVEYDNDHPTQLWALED